MTVESLPAEAISFLVKGAMKAGASPEYASNLYLKADEFMADFISQACGTTVTAEQIRAFGASMQTNTDKL